MFEIYVLCNNFLLSFEFVLSLLVIATMEPFGDRPKGVLRYYKFCDYECEMRNYLLQCIYHNMERFRLRIPQDITRKSGATL